jgi:hypothetical protein
VTAARPVTCIACSIFRREIEELQARGPLGVSVRYLGSMLHLVPAELGLQLDALIQQEQAKGQDILLGYGDCCAHMLDLQQEPGTSRLEGINCCEIILGRDRYRALRRTGAFFLLPEWALRWRAIFEEELGLTATNARDLMGDLHTRLLYLDTGLAPVPEAALEEASAFTGLPWEVLAVDLDQLRASLRDALAQGGRP